MSDSLLMAFGRVIGALAPIFLAVLSWLAIRVAALINARVKAERVRSALHRLDDAVFTAVREVEQVLVVSLKTASADGSLTDAERAEVKGAAIDAVRKYVGAKGWLQVGTVLGLSTDELERVLAARVEAAVYDLRGHPARVLSNVLRKARQPRSAATSHDQRFAIGACSMQDLSGDRPCRRRPLHSRLLAKWGRRVNTAEGQP